MSIRKFFRWVFYLLSAVVLVLVAIVAFFIFKIHRSISNLDAVPLSPANYEPAAVELVKLCQSDPSFFSQDSVSYLSPFDPVWAPPSVAKLHPEGLDIEAEHARIYWGGGFYHCGWQLDRGPATTDGAGYTWTLSFFSEGNQNRVLKNFVAPARLRLTEDEFIKQVLAEFNQRLASQADDGIYTSEATWNSAAARCVFLARHHRTDLLPSQVRKSAANYPHDWRDVLLEYLLNHADDPTAGGLLQNWADRTTGPAAWIYAAYAFYQSNDIQAGNAATKEAIAIVSPDPEWIDKNITSYELAMAVRLYDAGKFAACASLCDGILASRHRSFPNRSNVQYVHAAATATAASRPAKLPAFDKYALIDPFGDFDVNLLNATPAASQPSATEP